MVVPSASQSISIIWPIIVSIVIIPSITSLISTSTVGSISRCKILSIDLNFDFGTYPDIPWVYMGVVSYP